VWGRFTNKQKNKGRIVLRTEGHDQNIREKKGKKIREEQRQRGE
jgi:hypothetical protein